MDTLQKGTTVEQLKMAYDEAKAYAVEVTYIELAKKVDKVTGKGLSTNDYTTDDMNKLAGIAAGAEVNVQSDWNATEGDAFIKNKPSIPAAVAVKGNAESSYRTGNVNITPANIGLGNVGNFKAVSTAASQGLSDTEKSNARANIGAGTGNGTITGIKMNGASKGSSGVVDLGTVITAHQDISGKVNTSTKVNGHALTGNVTVSKTDVGLGNVTNDAQVKRTEMGVASGVATLDSAGKVPSSQLPSYVDDVLEYDTKSAFPATGEGGKIYVDKSNNTSWRWSGSAYTQIKGDLTIGTTSGTAADGKVVNDHINNTSNPHGVTKAQVGLGSVVNTGDSATPVSGGTTKFTTGGAYTELAKKVDKVTGKGLSTNDYTTDEKNKLGGIASGAEVNQNAFSNVGVKVGNTTTTVAADAKTDTVTLIQGSNVTLTADTTNDTITIAAKDTTYSSKAAASGGSDVSLVTTGEKYIWNSKTSNTGTVTSVAVKMNGATKGTVTTNGTIDLGTVITAHQDISGKVNKTTTVNGHALSGNVTVTKSDVGLGNVGNFKAVSTAASQGLTATERANARTNIAAVGETINTTWASLKSLRDGSQLIPGQWYRITDYVTTTAQENTQSAGHAFDVIVRADDVNVLNENAFAAKHAGDTYFANSDINAWELKYCLDNDTNRFAWATTNGGKGVIYFMRDEWDNECPYDFKNVQYVFVQGFTYNQWGNTYTFNRNSSLDEEVSGVKYYGYTCNTKPAAWSSANCFVTETTLSTSMTMYSSAGGSAISFGGSIVSANNDSFTTYTFDQNGNEASINGGSQSVFGNNIDFYIINNKQTLNVICFRTTGSTLFAYGNSFKTNCYGNSFGNGCYGNSFGTDCYGNSFKTTCRGNSFGNGCYGNSFGTDCSNNSFGNDCYGNSFGNSGNKNSFGNGCYGNSFGSSCYGNSFGTDCHGNSFRNNCHGNSFGNSCYGNSFETDCSNNSFGNECRNIKFQRDYTYYCIIENGNQNINITAYSTLTTSSSNKLQNFTIAQGVNNSNTVKTIRHNTVNDTFKTTYQNENSTTVNV